MLLKGARLEAPAAPLNDMLRIGLDAAPDEVAIVSAHRALSWRELDRASAALAGGYRRLGLDPGDRIASLMPNRIDLVVHYLACFRAGLVATPLNYRYTAREIDHALEPLPQGNDEPTGADGGWHHEFAALVESEPLDAGDPPDPEAPAAIFFT